MEQHQHEDRNSENDIRLSTESLRETIDLSAQIMADAAIQRCDREYQQQLQLGAQLWIAQRCYPDTMDKLGKTTGALVNTGRQQSAIEMCIYFIILSGFTGAGFWLLAAPVWAYIAGVPISSTVALFLSLSSDRK